MARIPLIKFIGQRTSNSHNIIRAHVDNKVRKVTESISAVKANTTSLFQPYFIHRVLLSQEEIDCVSLGGAIDSPITKRKSKAATEK